MRLAPGSLVGPYVIGASVGAGGMGEVFRARDPRLGREVAVKVLLGEGAPEPERLARFEQEARAAAALSHPNILTIHDVGLHEGRPYLVTELLEGRTLRELLQRGPLPARQVVALGLQLGRGLAAAHSVRIVHRDIKPENLFLTQDDTLKILDFGLAKLRPDTPLGSNETTLAASQSMGVSGTPAYMAPEQLRGEPLDGRADLFALGAVLYELLTASSPFRRQTAVATLAAILHEPAPPLDAPPALERLIRRCLEKEPGERFQSARDVVFALETALGAGESTAAPPPSTQAAPRSIAVLPFKDLSPTRDQDHLCEGLAEDLLVSLSRIAGLRIAARSSAFQFSEEARDVRAIGARLGVATVLEGSVRKIGDRLRVNVQLLDVADGYQRWSERYDRKLEDVFAIQDDIAERVATALRGVLSHEEKKALHHPETAVESYEYFLRGRQLLNRFSRPNIEAARGMFERAIELDPSYAPAWSGLAEAHAWTYQWWAGSVEDLERADRASRRALELAPNLAEAHAARGFALELARRYDDAAAEFEQALRINPDLFDALYLYARSAFSAGRIEKSVELFRRAGDARSEDFQSMILLGQSLNILGRAAEAREAIREGVRRAERALELNPTDSRALSLGGTALGDLGEADRALRWSARALELYPDEQSVLINGACLRAKLGRKAEALEILERVFERGYGQRDWIERDPDYDSLRDEPRFKALLDKLH
jgi:serine/threonine protein kinase/tetratricopeptide (TPR) repeat protein